MSLVEDLLGFIVTCSIGAIFAILVFAAIQSSGEEKLKKTQYDLGYKQAVIEMYEHKELQKDMYLTAKGF